MRGFEGSLRVVRLFKLYLQLSRQHCTDEAQKAETTQSEISSTITKFYSCPRSFASRPTVHFLNNLSALGIILRYTSRRKGFIYLIYIYIYIYIYGMAEMLPHVWDTRGGFLSFTSIADISTALMRPRRPKQYCLQLYIYLFIYIILHKLGCFVGISTTEKNHITTGEKLP